MTPVKPNLFIIGAMKSATSSLHGYLGSHPDVFMSEPKEPGYFVEELAWSCGEPWYLDLFANAGGRSVVGESSTEYTKAPWYGGVPERIARFNPDARFIYLMRDPVERTISHYWHTVVQNSERRSLFQAIREEPHYRQVSYYGMQLEPYFRIFGADRVLTLTFEELKGSPRGVVQRVFQWLGVDAAFVPPNLDQRANATPEVVERVRGRGLLHRFRYSKIWNAVGPNIPSSLRRIARTLSEDRVDRTSESVHEVIEYLRPEQRDQVAELVSELGRDFPEWKTLYGNSPMDVPSSAMNLANGHS